MRLIDLRCHWFRQYYPELTNFDRSADADLKGRVSQLDGYLSETSAAVLLCSRTPADWANTPEPWRLLADLIARYQAEFSGRILMGPDDAERWAKEPKNGLCWGLIGVDGFDFLIRSPTDLDRIPLVFDRGVRLFQAVATSNSQLGGSLDPGDDRGLTDLGKLFLERLLGLSNPPAPGSPRPILDLAGMNGRTMGDVLDWLESEPGRIDRIPLVVSRCAVAHPDALGDSSLLIPLDLVGRIRALGGTLGLALGSPWIASEDDLLAQVKFLESIPYRGEPGTLGISFGTDYLGMGVPAHGFRNAESIIKWVRQQLDPADANCILFENGRGLILASIAPPSASS